MRLSARRDQMLVTPTKPLPIWRMTAQRTINVDGRRASSDAAACMAIAPPPATLQVLGRVRKRRGDTASRPPGMLVLTSSVSGPWRVSNACSILEV